MRDRRQGRLVVGIDDEARDLVGLVRNRRRVEEGGERQIGERILGGHAFLTRSRRDAGQHVAAAQRRGFGKQRHQIGKDITLAADRRAIHAAGPPNSIRRVAAYHHSALPAGCPALLPTTETVILMPGNAGASSVDDTKHGWHEERMAAATRLPYFYQQ